MKIFIVIFCAFQIRAPLIPFPPTSLTFTHLASVVNNKLLLPTNLDDNSFFPLFSYSHPSPTNFSRSR